MWLVFCRENSSIYTKSLKTKYYLFIRAYLGKRSEAAGTFVVIFQIESIHILLSKDIICNGIIWPTGEIGREVVATTNV